MYLMSFISLNLTGHELIWSCTKFAQFDVVHRQRILYLCYADTTLDFPTPSHSD